MCEYVLRSYGLTKQYNRQKAVENVCMNIKKGEIYGFIGRNGAGKTTMMKMIMGITSPTAGDIELFGKKGSNQIEKARHKIGAMIESASLYTHLTAYENLEYVRRIYGVNEKNIVEKVLEQVGLLNTGKKKAGNFSMGMKQRLGIGMALLISPEFLMLDEPINGLDPQGTVEMRNLILRLNKEEHITFMISSHILDELSKIATGYGIIDNGVLIEEISAEELNDKCRSYLELQVDDIDKTESVLKEKLDITKVKAEPNGTIKIFEPTRKAGEINRCLVQNQIDVESIIMKSISLEDYFLGLKGNRNA